MIGLDANVVLRYIMQDDNKQAKRAATLVESLTADVPGFISIVTLVEIVWVLSSSYKLTRDQVTMALEQLLHTKEIILDRADQILKALRLFKVSNADFADCLIVCIGTQRGCEKTMTFDIGAAKAAGMTLIR